MLSAQMKNQKNIENFGHMQSNSLGKAITLNLYYFFLIFEKWSQEQEEIAI